MKIFYCLSLAIVLTLAACTPDEGGTASPSPGEPALAEPEPDIPYLAGTIRLHGRLIEPPDGALHLVAKGKGMATPLVLKLPLHEGQPVEGAEALDLEFRLGKSNGMLGEMPRSAVPEELDFEVSWTPDGFVPGIIDVHTKRLTVRTGQADLDVQMYPGAIDPTAAESEGGRPWPRRQVAPAAGSPAASGD